MNDTARGPGAAASSRLQDRLARALLTRFSPAGAAGRLSVLVFHRVLPEPDELKPDEVDRRQFDAICTWLSSWYQVLPLDEAVQALQSGSLPARALALTFDDGYADNCEVALPILRQHGLVATFFVANGFLDGGRMWNDTVIESIRACPLPMLELSLGALGVAGFEQLDLNSVTARRAAIQRLLAAIKYLDPAQRQAAAQHLADRVGMPLPRQLMMSSEQVRSLAAAGMRIGAHTVSHPILARLDETAARHEILQSKLDLEQLLGQPVTLFAYPNGKPGLDYQRREVELVRQAGFAAALSTSPGAARRGDGVFQLPRFTPWDRRRWAFGARMLRNLSTPLALA